MSEHRVEMDRERCVGTGSCVMTEPAVFDQDQGDGRVTLLTDTVGDDLLPTVEEAVNLCPNYAVWLADR